jgi:hypothetical protein
MRNLFVVTVVFLSFAGCKCPEATVGLEMWQQIRPEYETYVGQDPKMDEWEKLLRKQHCDLLEELLKKGAK